MQVRIGDTVAVRSKGIGTVKNVTKLNGTEGFEVATKSGYRIFVPLLTQDRLLRPLISSSAAYDLLKILRTPGFACESGHSSPSESTPVPTMDDIATRLMSGTLEDFAIELRALYDKSPDLTGIERRKILALETELFGEIAHVTKTDIQAIAKEFESLRDVRPTR